MQQRHLESPHRKIGSPSGWYRTALIAATFMNLAWPAFADSPPNPPISGINPNTIDLGPVTEDSPDEIVKRDLLEFASSDPVRPPSKDELPGYLPLAAPPATLPVNADVNAAAERNSDFNASKKTIESTTSANTSRSDELVARGRIGLFSAARRMVNSRNSDAEQNRSRLGKVRDAIPKPAVRNSTPVQQVDETDTDVFADLSAPLKPEPKIVVTRQMAALQTKLSKTIRFYLDNPLNTRDDSPWSVMHSVLGYGPYGTLALNGEKGKRVNAVNWMCMNNACSGLRLLYLDKGRVKGKDGPGYQGHPGQFLAMLAQINLSREQPLRVQGNSLKVEDLIWSEMQTCVANQELTFKLISLSHYLRSDAQWKCDRGEVWNIARLLELELQQPINSAACGGTHRIMGISRAVRTRERRGEPIDGVFLQAKNYMRKYQSYAMTLRHSDGSFSSDWFKARTNWGDQNRKLQTTGHILEWLVYSLPRNELSDPRIVRSVDYLANLMVRHRFHDWEVGPRGHAIRALALYHKRVFEKQPKQETVARVKSTLQTGLHY